MAPGIVGGTGPIAGPRPARDRPDPFPRSLLVQVKISARHGHLSDAAQAVDP